MTRSHSCYLASCLLLVCTTPVTRHAVAQGASNQQKSASAASSKSSGFPHLQLKVPLVIEDVVVLDDNGQPVYINNAADAAYANAWLLKYGANNIPPSTITPGNYKGLTGLAYLTTYRLFNDYGGSSPVGSLVGWTTDPCGFGPPVPGQAHDNNGATGTTKPGNNTYQLAEGRVGSFGQSIYATLNNKQSVPLIWSVVEFNAQGASVNLGNSANYQIFPTYYVYVNGALSSQYTITQTSVSTITQPGYQNSQLLPSQIQ